MQLQVSTDGKINGRLSSIFQVTLDGTNGSIKFLNFTKGDTFTLILKQDSTGSRTATFTGVTWQAVDAPSLQTAPGAQDVFTFTCTGTGTFTDAAGASSRLPKRVTVAALSTIVGAGVVALTVVSSGGGGQRPGAASLPNAQSWGTGSGTSFVRTANMTASGQLVLGQSGGLIVGSPSLDGFGTDAKVIVKANGNTRIKGTLSGGVTTINGGSPGKVLCVTTGGTISFCQGSPASTGCGCK